MSTFLTQYNEFVSKYAVFCKHHHCNNECPLHELMVSYLSLRCIYSIDTNPEKYIPIVENWYVKYKDDYTPVK